MNDSDRHSSPLRRPPENVTEAAVDAKNPWLGLASFTEDTRSFFYGREEEVAELARRVQRRLLTVLFGKSGLGKTSILRAGLVPRLRAQGYCPVYVRIDYGRDAPEPAEQIKEAIRRAASGSGEWTRTGVASAGESLWEYLHHRDDLLKSDSGATIVPLLIFDQFEEIFTLAQSDDFGRARASRFIEELADLVENRPPKSLEARLDSGDETAAERFDFARSDYRVLIALREDYLAPLEGLKRLMPSISQNRLRLAPMTGTQALEAVLRPGRGIVSEEVAAAIVRFVAGGAELANAEVEPSLLSLICRELNDARVRDGRSEISLDLLAGSHASILSNFYERALADQPATVRRIIEDDLLTDSGYRENVSEESLLHRLTAAGASPESLPLLVNRRLLRVEERLDIRRVELTHDVLCAVVKNSRDRRREREAREATERLLAEQGAREQAAREALTRARRIALGCTVLAAVAIAAALVALINVQRARRAEQQALRTRAVAEQARAQSEHLLGYLTDDFVRELESFGRLQVINEFTQRQIDYFHALPQDLKSSETIRNGALALVHHARSLRYLGDLDAAGASVDEAVQLLTGLRQHGDESESTKIGLARALTTQAQILDNRNDPQGPVAAHRSADLLRPLVERQDASVEARRAYVETLTRIAFEQQNATQLDAAMVSARTAMDIADQLGAHGSNGLIMGAQYAEAGAWLVTALGFAGHDDEARRAGADVLQVADQVLEQRPGYRLALHAEQVTLGALSSVAQNELDPAEALRIGLREEEVGITLLRLDPKNTTSLNNLASAQNDVADALWTAGRTHESLDYYVKSTDGFGRATVGGPTFFLTHAYQMAITAIRQAQAGDNEGAVRTVAGEVPYASKLKSIEKPGSFNLVLVNAVEELPTGVVAFERDDLATAERVARSTLEAVQAGMPFSEFQRSQQNFSVWLAARLLGQTQYRLGQFAEGERSNTLALQARKVVATDSINDRRDLAELSTWIALSQARQGHNSEAAQTVRPVVAFYRQLMRRNHGNQWVPLEFAVAVYAQALAEPSQRSSLLAEAARQLEQMPANLRSLHDVRQWIERVREAQQSRAADLSSSAPPRLESGG
jgi:AAA+ ATPase superfamily predicted ATPase